MAITFNNILNTERKPGVYTEVDNSRALQGLLANPHKVLAIVQKNVDANNPTLGNAESATLYQIGREAVAEGYFGNESLGHRIIRKFKANNENTDVYAIAVSGGTVQAQCRIDFSAFLSHTGGSCSTFNEPVNLYINGKRAQVVLTENMLAASVALAFKTLISEAGTYPCTASYVSYVSAGDATAVGGDLILSMLNSGTFGNYADARFNYNEGESFPTCFISGLETASYISQFGVHVAGVGDPDLDDVWAVIENEKFEHIINPYIDATNLTSIETELADRFKPNNDKQGFAYTGLRGTQASATTLGNSRNSPHQTIMAAYNSPTPPEEWAAALAGQGSFNLNQDPARPLHGLQLVGVLPPPSVDVFTPTERDLLLYDGIATWTKSSDGKIQIERMITTYQSNAAGIPDPSYLDSQTLFTLNEIRFQYKSRMTTRFIVPRFKLASDSQNVLAGQKTVRPKDIKQEVISLFRELSNNGLVENIDDFVENLVVERNASDVNRVDVLLPPDLVNQFRVLATLLQFIL